MARPADTRWTYDGEQPDVRLRPQKLGAQTEEILKDLYETGAIGVADSHH